MGPSYVPVKTILTNMKPLQAIAAALILLSAQGHADEPALFTTENLTPDTALKAARAALQKCRDEGYQVAVVVTDRNGLPQVMIRDRYAGAHTPETARRKAWTAASFRSGTTELVSVTAAGTTLSGIRHVEDAIMLGGGLLIDAGGSTVGAIGVSGAPGGDLDDLCAQAGIDAIEEDILF